MFRKIGGFTLAIALSSGTIQAGMIEQVLYNVVGQVSNAVGARLGDEIYYGSSSPRVVEYSAPRSHHRKRRHRKKRHVKKHKNTSKKVVKKKAVPIMTDEMKIQKALASLGFYKGKIDGEINSYETRSAIKMMNKEYGLGNNAFLSPQVRDSLIYLGNLFKFDRALIASGTDKKTKGMKLQTALKILGFYNSKIDGLVGSGTRKSIAAYKSANGMAANGTLDFEEEYRLITKAKELNEKNIEETIASIKALAKGNREQQLAGQSYQKIGKRAVVQSLSPSKRVDQSDQRVSVQAVRESSPSLKTSYQPAHTITPSPEAMDQKESRVDIAPSKKSMQVSQHSEQLGRTPTNRVVVQEERKRSVAQKSDKEGVDGSSRVEKREQNIAPQESIPVNKSVQERNQKIVQEERSPTKSQEEMDDRLVPGKKIPPSTIPIAEKIVQNQKELP